MARFWIVRRWFMKEARDTHCEFLVLKERGMGYEKPVVVVVVIVGVVAVAVAVAVVVMEVSAETGWLLEVKTLVYHPSPYVGQDDTWSIPGVCI